MRSLLLGLALTSLPLSALAAPPVHSNTEGNWSIVNGTITDADHWSSFVTLDVDENKIVLARLRELGVTDIQRFINDFNYARSVLFDGDDINDPAIKEEVKMAQEEAKKALNNQIPLKHNCGGTLIDNNWVLTAAHCTDFLEENNWIKVRVPGNAKRKEAYYEAADIKIHPRYQGASLEESLGIGRANDGVNPATWDVSLIRLSAPVKEVVPMKLAGVADAIPRTGTGIVAGSGGVTWDPKKGDYDEDPKRLIRQAEVPFNKIEVCDHTDSMICAEKPSQDLKITNPASCYGDSGGPLVIMQPDGTKVQYGIVSHTATVSWLEQLKGKDCGHAPTNYSAVSVLAPWILESTGKRVPLTEGIKETKIDAKASKIVMPIPSGEFDPTDLGIHLARVRGAIRPEKARQITGVVLASKESAADALAGGVLQDDQILMLTDGKELDKRTLAELQRLRPKVVTVLGGYKVMSALTEARLLSAGFKVNRLAGESRLETAQMIAQSRVSAHPGVTTTFVSRGYGKEGVVGSETADALALGAASAREHMPTLLSPTAKAPDKLLDWLQFNSGYKNAVIVGGPEAVTPEFQSTLNRRVGMTTDRIAGEDRVKTALALAKRVKDPTRVVVVDAKSAHSWKAAFQVAGLAADLNAPVVLADGDVLPSDTKEFLTKVKATKEGPALVCVAQAKACDAAASALGL